MRRVAVIVNNVEGYARGILRGVMPFAFARGWECSVMGVGLKLASHNIGPADGVIVQASSVEQITKLLGLRVPVVNVSSSLQVESVPSVVSDDIAVGRLGAEHFLRRGFRSFVWYAPLNRHFAKLRQQGFTSRLVEEGLKSTIASDRSTLNGVLANVEKPAAIMCCNDITALEVLEQCRQTSLRIPDQVAVLGVDNDDLIQSLASPPLSSIGTATEQIGFEAGVLLEKLMQKQTIAALYVTIPPTGVITRRSTDLTAVSDNEVAGALRFIREHANGSLGIEQILQSVTVSRRQLERRFRAILGRSMLDEIRRCRVERARQLLLDTDLTIPQIATASGFSSASYLTVVFGEMVGETPGNFRKTIRSRSVIYAEDIV
jgi:LacI family transcriptional regulator